LSEFYTNVTRYANQLLYRGYQNGKRISKRIKYQPTLYVSTPKGDWKALDGTPCAPIKMDSMRDAKEWIAANKETAGRTIFGNDKYISCFINEEFPGVIDFDRNSINVTTIDIEVASDDGFPEPEVAEQPVISITSKNNIDNTYYVWGLQDYDVENSYMQTHRVIYKQFDTEAQLLMDFIDFWHSNTHCPDVITGWNVKFFDIPYLVNRSLKVLGEDMTRKFSPWGMIDRRDVTTMGRSQCTYELKGISVVDYLELFKKFGYSYGPQESYKLDHIAHVVLGENKLSYEEHGSLHSLYLHDFQKIH